MIHGRYLLANPQETVAICQMDYGRWKLGHFLNPIDLLEAFKEGAEIDLHFRPLGGQWPICIQYLVDKQKG